MKTTIAFLLLLTLAACNKVTDAPMQATPAQDALTVIWHWHIYDISTRNRQKITMPQGARIDGVFTGEKGPQLRVFEPNTKTTEQRVIGTLRLPPNSETPLGYPNTYLGWYEWKEEGRTWWYFVFEMAGG